MDQLTGALEMQTDDVDDVDDADGVTTDTAIDAIVNTIFRKL